MIMVTQFTSIGKYGQKIELGHVQPAYALTYDQNSRANCGL